MTRQVMPSLERTPSSGERVLPLGRAYSMLGPLLFPDDFLNRIPGRVRWIIEETTGETYPSYNELKATGGTFPSITHGHPILSSDEIRHAYVTEAYFNYQTDKMDKWFKKHKVRRSKIKGEICVDKSTLENALLKSFPIRWPKLKKRRDAAAQLAPFDETESSDRASPKNRSGRPAEYNWGKAIVVTTLAAIKLPQPPDTTQIKDIIETWFRTAPLEEIFTKEHLDRLGKDNRKPLRRKPTGIAKYAQIILEGILSEQHSKKPAK